MIRRICQKIVEWLGARLRSFKWDRWAVRHRGWQSLCRCGKPVKHRMRHYCGHAFIPLEGGEHEPNQCGGESWFLEAIWEDNIPNEAWGMWSHYHLGLYFFKNFHR